jgi:hypothetical protein
VTPSRQLRLAALLLVGAFVPALAHAAPVRVAIVYGHNGGDGPRTPLRYAEADAARVAQALTEVGQVNRENLQLLQGQSVAKLLAALDWAKGRVADRDSVLLVYLSAHADATRGLLPGREQLEWKTLKAAIAATNAKVRVTIVDGCQSSGLLEAGAHVAPTFAIDASESLTVKGDVFITSSASNEPSLEAGQFRGSVFTQHLVAGLRGAADKSGDGRVSLDEAYRFAFERTQEGSSGQHAGFANRLTGYGELQLTSLERASGLVLPEGAVTVRDADSAEPVISVRGSARLALPPGRYRVEVEQNGAVKEGGAVVTPGAFERVDVSQLGTSAKQARLLRLGATQGPSALDVVLPRPDPVLLDVAARLRALSSTSPRQLTLERENALVVVSSGAWRASFKPDEPQALLAAVEAWLAAER